AREALHASGEAPGVQERHARYIVGLLEQVEPRLYGPEQVRWTALLAAEQDNVRAALRWSIDTGEFEFVSRILRRVAYVRWLHGRTTEAGRWAEEVLAARGVATHQVVQARARVILGMVAMLHSYERGVAPLRDARALAAEPGDSWVEGHSLALEGFLAPLRGD